MAYKLICPVVLDQEYALASVTKSGGQLVEDLLLSQCDLLCAILVSVGTHLTLFCRIEYDCKTRRFQRLENE
jgi:hypothetical protein